MIIASLCEASSYPASCPMLGQHLSSFGILTGIVTSILTEGNNGILTGIVTAVANENTGIVTGVVSGKKYLILKLINNDNREDTTAEITRTETKII